MPAGTRELVSKGYMLRRDQAEEIEALAAARPGSSLSDVVRELVDFGIPAYKERQELLRTLDRRSA